MTDPDKQKEIEELHAFIASTEKSLGEARKSLLNLTGGKSDSTTKDSLSNLKTDEAGKIIEGIFDGENMIAPGGKIFPVPANYASKSKLVEGDRLKLTVSEDGSFIYKQIGPVPRKKVIGTLNFENNTYHVLAEGKVYNVLFASVTYFKAKPGDRVTIVIPEKEDTTWSALENIIHDVNQLNESGENMNQNDSNDNEPDPENTESEVKKEDADYVSGEAGVENDTEVDPKDGRETLPDGHFSPLVGTDDDERNSMGERIAETQKDIDLEV